jgi:uncharacterized membrane protein YdbT with pleckstrin-like domain
VPMPFPKKLLNEGEEIVLDLRPHWWFLVGPAAALLVTVVASILLISVHGFLHDYGLWVTTGLAVLSLLWFAGRYWRWTTTEFIVTSDRLIRRDGIFAKNGKEIPLERLNDISYHQTAFERIIGTGDLMIESAGKSGQEVFPDLPKPGLVQNEIYRQIELMKTRDADRMAGRRELSVPEQLEKLDELRQRGIISQAEFDAKKAQLLERM